MVIAQVNDSVGAASQIKLTSVGALAITDGSTTVATTLLNVAPLNHLHLEWNVSQTHGASELRVYKNADPGDPPNELLNATYTKGAITRYQHGAVASPPASWMGWFDDINLRDVYTAPMPPLSTITTFINEGFEAGTLSDPLTNITTDFSTISGGGLTFDNVKKIGTLSAKVDSGASATAQVMEKAFTSNDDLSCYFDFWLSSLPVGTGLTVASVVNGSTLTGAVRVETDGTLSIRNVGTQVARSLSDYVPGSRMHLEWHTNASTGKQELRIFKGSQLDTDVPTEFIQGAYTGPTASKFRAGLVAGVGINFTGWFDKVRVTDETVTPLVTPPTTVVVDEPFESGTNGAALTSSNTTLDSFAGSVTFDSAIKKRGSLSAKLDSTGAGDNVTVRKNFTAISDGKIFIRTYAYFTAIAPAIVQFCHVADGATLQAAYWINTNGTIRLTNGFTVLGNSIQPQALNKWTRFDWTLNLDLGTQSLGIYTKTNLEGSTPTEVLTGALSGVVISNIMWGAISGHPVNWIAYLDDIAADTAQMPAPTGTPDSDTTFTRRAKSGSWVHAVNHKLHS